MNGQPDLTKFRQRLAEEKRKREQEEAEKAVSTFEDDLIPESEYERTPEENELDAALDSINVIDAYKRWCGKMIPKVQGKKREGIMISCPIPGHVDSNPSAWINLDKQTWFCGGCQEGGDKYDIAAYWLGFSVPGYKEGADFHKLREKMASDFGYTINKGIGGSITVTPPEPEPDTKEPEPGAPSTDSLSLASVTSITGEEDVEDGLASFKPLDWKAITPPQTFLDTYMKSVVIDDAPEEFHFFNALIAIGFALGRKVVLNDLKPVRGNLFVCSLGRTGLGKSKAKSYLDEVLRRAMPYDASAASLTGSGSAGVRILGGTGSAENLIYQFQEPIPDPANPKNLLGYAPVKGLVDFNELSALMAVSNRPGSAMKPVLMEFYDASERITSSSMGTGTKHAEQPFASALTTTQPSALRDLVSKKDDASGFLNRWLFIPGTPKRKIAIGGAMVDMSDAAKSLQDLQGWAETIKEQVKWSDAAADRFTDFFDTVIEPTKKASQNDILVRMDLSMKKLILLFAANRFEKEVSLQSVEDAVFCWDYLLSAYEMTWGAIRSTEEQEAYDYIIEFIKRCAREKKGTPQASPTKREIKNSCRRRGYSNQLIEKTLISVVGFDEIEEFKTQGRGRPTSRYRYVD